MVFWNCCRFIQIIGRSGQAGAAFRSSSFFNPSQTGSDTGSWNSNNTAVVRSEEAGEEAGAGIPLDTSPVKSKAINKISARMMRHFAQTGEPVSIRAESSNFFLAGEWSRPQLSKSHALFRMT